MKYLLLFILILYFSHKEIKVIYDFESMRYCPLYSKIIYVASIIKNKVVFSYYYNKEVKDISKYIKQSQIEINYIGYFVTVNNCDINSLIIHLDNIPILGVIIDENTMETIKPLKRVPKHIVILYSSVRNMDCNIELFYKYQVFWSMIGISHRLN